MKSGINMNHFIEYKNFMSSSFWKSKILEQSWDFGIQHLKRTYAYLDLFSFFSVSQSKVETCF